MAPTCPWDVLVIEPLLAYFGADPGLTPLGLMPELAGFFLVELIEVFCELIPLLLEVFYLLSLVCYLVLPDEVFDDF
jgi:hypothetical protein